MRFEPDAWSLRRPQFGDLHTVLVQPVKTPPASLVVLCHGFGAPGTDLVGVFEDILYHLPEDASKPAMLFPEAPIGLEEQGMPDGRAWWELNMAQLMQMAATNSFALMRDAVPAGIDSARVQLCECIAQCRSEQKWEELPIVLGGFSQGAMLSVDTLLRGNVPNVVGLLAFSGALICESLWRQAAQNRSLDLPIVQSHGKLDQVLPIETGRWLHELLSDLGGQGQLIEFHGPHTIPNEAIEQAAKLISSLS